MSPRHALATFTPPDLALAAAERSRFQHAGLAVNTTLAYQRDWRVFRAWCAAAGRTALPASADTVELYASDLLRRGRKITTVERHAAGIHHYHRVAGAPSPCGPELRALFGGARRLLCQRPNQKDAITLAELRKMVRATGHRTPIAARNTALLLFGFASALRRSNLAALDREHLTFTPKGVLVRIDHEKQDREGAGREVAVPYGKGKTTCPVRALERWLTWRGRERGALFTRLDNVRPRNAHLSKNAIANIVKRAIARAGLDASRFCTHSLRAGLITEAGQRGVSHLVIAAQSGHRSLDSLQRYFRPLDLFRANACTGLGL